MAGQSTYHYPKLLSESSSASGINTTQKLDPICALLFCQSTRLHMLLSFQGGGSSCTTSRFGFMLSRKERRIHSLGQGRDDCVLPRLLVPAMREVSSFAAANIINSLSVILFHTIS
jgi:hypothetical protein